MSDSHPVEAPMRIIIAATIVTLIAGHALAQSPGGGQTTQPIPPTTPTQTSPPTQPVPGQTMPGQPSPDPSPLGQEGRPGQSVPQPPFPGTSAPTPSGNGAPPPGTMTR